MIGRIERLAVRSVWLNEAHDFTTWLYNNIDALNAALDLNITTTKRERKIGNWRVDIEGEDDLGVVVIENQLEKSDHEHLGKLLNYAVALSATRAIWITTDPHPTHTDVINRLNEEMGIKFYLVKIEAIKIGESEPAPMITLVTGPSEESEGIGQVLRGRTEDEHNRIKFWDVLLTLSSQKTHLHSGNSPNKSIWISSSADWRGCRFQYWIHPKHAIAEFRIDGKSPDHNSAMFQYLQNHKREIEDSLGSDLEWLASEKARV